MKSKYTTLAIVLSLFLPLSALSTTSYFPLANCQPENEKLPVLLIHGYASNSSVWKNWETLLKTDNITFKVVAFKDYNETWANEDGCGSAAMIGVISYGAGQGVTAQNMLQMGDRGE